MILEKETALYKENAIKNDIDEARQIASNTAQYFWTKTTGGTSAVPTGAYITETTRANFETNVTGGNLLLRSNGMTIRNGVESLGKFTASGAQIGKDSEMHLKQSASEIEIGNANNTAPVKIKAYDDGTDQYGQIVLDNPEITMVGSHGSMAGGIAIDSLSLIVNGINNNRYAELTLETTGRNDRVRRISLEDEGITVTGPTEFENTVTFDKPVYIEGMEDRDEAVTVDVKTYIDSFFRYRVTDLDDAFEPGFYYYPENASHAPTSASGVVIAIKYSDTFQHQIALRNSSNGAIGVYVRMCNASGWTSWKTVTLT